MASNMAMCDGGKVVAAFVLRGEICEKFHAHCSPESTAKRWACSAADTYKLAPQIAEWPFRQHVVGRRERYTKYHK